MSASRWGDLRRAARCRPPYTFLRVSLRARSFSSSGASFSLRAWVRKSRRMIARFAVHLTISRSSCSSLGEDGAEFSVAMGPEAGFLVWFVMAALVNARERTTEGRMLGCRSVYTDARLRDARPASGRACKVGSAPIVLKNSEIGALEKSAKTPFESGLAFDGLALKLGGPPRALSLFCVALRVLF